MEVNIQIERRPKKKNFLMAYIITDVMNLFAAVIISTARIPTRPEEPVETDAVPLATTIPDTAASSN